MTLSDPLLNLCSKNNWHLSIIVSGGNWCVVEGPRPLPLMRHFETSEWKSSFSLSFCNVAVSATCHPHDSDKGSDICSTKTHRQMFVLNTDERGWIQTAAEDSTVAVLRELGLNRQEATVWSTVTWRWKNSPASLCSSREDGPAKGISDKNRG